MKEYLIPFLAYIFVMPVVNFFFNDNVAYLVHAIIAILLLAVFWKRYKLNFRLDFLAVITGAAIFIIWIGLENPYFHFYEIKFIPLNEFFLAAKIAGFILAAPLIEELFTRGFLMRILIDNDWKKVPIGKYTLSSFIITVLFFGLSHNRWLVGIITGILLNLLLYKRKRIDSCIQAHFVANLLLAIFIISTSAWNFW
ncbi:MAG: CAAX prenyl protease-related protein [Nanoarchaeota archaeon]|nr:CAAX prenyl protease-related protein [Nanoarchaeota archaeon]